MTNLKLNKGSKLQITINAIDEDKCSIEINKGFDPCNAMHHIAKAVYEIAGHYPECKKEIVALLNINLLLLEDD